jgi:hypothetical protein
LRRQRVAGSGSLQDRRPVARSPGGIYIAEFVSRCPALWTVPATGVPRNQDPRPTLPRPCRRQESEPANSYALPRGSLYINVASFRKALSEIQRIRNLRRSSAPGTVPLRFAVLDHIGQDLKRDGFLHARFRSVTDDPRASL